MRCSAKNPRKQRIIESCGLCVVHLAFPPVRINALVSPSALSLLPYLTLPHSITVMFSTCVTYCWINCFLRNNLDKMSKLQVKTDNRGINVTPESAALQLLVSCSRKRTEIYDSITIFTLSVTPDNTVGTHTLVCTHLCVILIRSFVTGK